MLYLVVPVAVIIGFIWALVVFPSFRVVAVILVLIGFALYTVASQNIAREQKEREAADQQARVQHEASQKAYCEAEEKRQKADEMQWAIVPASQIELRNPSLTPEHYVSSNYALTASAKNKSKSTVNALRIGVTALDCPTLNARTADCEAIGHDDGIFNVNIPANEVRQISGKFTMRNVPTPRGVFSPRFAVTGARAANDQTDTDDTHELIRGFLSYKCPVEG